MYFLYILLVISTYQLPLGTLVIFFFHLYRVSALNYLREEEFVVAQSWRGCGASQWEGVATTGVLDRWSHHLPSWETE